MSAVYRIRIYLDASRTDAITQPNNGPTLLIDDLRQLLRERDVLAAAVRRATTMFDQLGLGSGEDMTAPANSDHWLNRKVNDGSSHGR